VGAQAQVRLARVLIALGQRAEGEALLRTLPQGDEQRLGPDDELAAECRDALAGLAAAGG